MTIPTIPQDGRTVALVVDTKTRRLLESILRTLTLLRDELRQLNAGG